MSTAPEDEIFPLSILWHSGEVNDRYFVEHSTLAAILEALDAVLVCLRTQSNTSQWDGQSFRSFCQQSLEIQSELVRIRGSVHDMLMTESL
jgi:hypothetical protein